MKLGTTKDFARAGVFLIVLAAAGSPPSAQAAPTSWQSVDLPFELLEARINDPGCRGSPVRSEACLLALDALAALATPPRTLAVDPSGVRIALAPRTPRDAPAFERQSARERGLVSAWRERGKPGAVSFSGLLAELQKAVESSGDLATGTGDALRAYTRRMEDPHTELAPYAAVADVLHHRVADPVISFMTRDRSRRESVSFGQLFSRGNRLGLIELRRVDDVACENVSHALLELSARGTGGWILDLRGNSGGVASEADCILDLFLEEDTALYRLEPLAKDFETRFFRAPGAALTGAPLVVLIDGGTASGAEVIAAVIQARQRGRIVGERSFGKGTYQAASPWKDHPGVVWYRTVARIVIEPGYEFQMRGVSPGVDYATGVTQLREANAYVNPIPPNYPPVPVRGYGWSNGCPRSLEPDAKAPDGMLELGTRVLVCEIQALEARSGN